MYHYVLAMTRHYIRTFWGLAAPGSWGPTAPTSAEPAVPHGTWIFFQNGGNMTVATFLVTEKKRSKDSCLQGGEYRILSSTNQ